VKMVKKRTVHLEKDEISEVAARLFAEKGFVGTSMRDISNALNVSVASVYYYYKNKEDLLHSIIASIGDELLVALRKGKAESDSATEQLRRMIFYHIWMIKEKGDRVKVYVEEQHNLSKKYSKIIFKQHREIYDLYVDQLRVLKEARVISCDPLSIAAFTIVGTLNWCYRWFRKDGELTIEVVAEKITNLLFYGIINNKCSKQ